jgi:hypothetical protein
MKIRFLLFAFLCFALVAGSMAQQRTSARGKGAAPVTGLAKVCEDPYNGEELKAAWPQAPIYLLFKRANSKVWGANASIKLPGMQAPTPASAHTLVCILEEHLEMGSYESGARAYTPSWDVYLIRLPDHGIYFQKTGIFGGNAPSIKWHPGAGVGSQPVLQLQEWLRLVLKTDVAGFRLRFPYTSSDKVRQIVFSGNGARIAVSHEPYHYSSPQPDGKKLPLVSIFDVASGQKIADIPVEGETEAVALSENGELIATEHYGHPQVWDVSSGGVIRKIPVDAVRSLAFGADGNLGVGTKEQAMVFNPRTGDQVFSGPGRWVQYSKERWIAASADGASIYDLRSGQPIAHFPATDGRLAISGDGLSEFTFSILHTEVRWAGKKAEYVEMPSIGSEGTGRVSAVASSPNGFVAGSNDGIVALLSPSGATKLFATDHSQIEALAVSPDGKLLSVGDSSGKVSLWELR